MTSVRSTAGLFPGVRLGSGRPLVAATSTDQRGGAGGRAQ
jgi:hypothetical protein